MAGERRPGRVVSAPEHLPPLELLPYITESNGYYKVTERIETPVNDYGVPDVAQTLQLLGEFITYDESYVDTIDFSIANVHHHAYPRRSYARHELESVLRDHMEYREAAVLKTQMYIPFHNAKHLFFINPNMPPRSVMRECAREQRVSRELFGLARNAVWFESLNAGDLRGLTARRLESKRMSSRDKFYQYLEAQRPGQVGILPDLDELAVASLTSVVQQLESVARYDTGLSIQESTAIIVDASRKMTAYDEAA